MGAVAESMPFSPKDNRLQTSLCQEMVRVTIDRCVGGI